MSEQRPGRTRVDGTPDTGTPRNPTPEQPDAGGEAGVTRERAAQARERAERTRAEAADATAAAEAAEAAAVAAEAAEAAGPADIPQGDPVADADLRAEEAGADEEFPLGRPGRPMNRRSPFRIGFAGALGAGFAYLL